LKPNVSSTWVTSLLKINTIKWMHTNYSYEILKYLKSLRLLKYYWRWVCRYDFKSARVFKNDRSSDTPTISLVSGLHGRLAYHLIVNINNCDEQWVRAKFLVNQYPLPVTVRLAWYTTHPELGQCSHKCSEIARSREHRYSRLNFAAIMWTSWDIHYFISTSGYRSPSLIHHSPCHRTVLAQVQLC